MRTFPTRAVNPIESLTNRAFSRHLFLGDELLLFTLEDSEKNQIYLWLAREQLIYIVPYGAGGTRWPKDEKVALLQVGYKIAITIAGKCQLWTIKKIEPLSELENLITLEK